MRLLFVFGITKVLHVFVHCHVKFFFTFFENFQFSNKISNTDMCCYFDRASIYVALYIFLIYEHLSQSNATTSSYPLINHMPTVRNSTTYVQVNQLHHKMLFEAYNNACIQSILFLVQHNTYICFDILKKKIHNCKQQYNIPTVKQFHINACIQSILSTRFQASDSLVSYSQSRRGEHFL